MALHPVNDRFKVKKDKDPYGFNSGDIPAETGIVVEVPDMLLYLSFHSFAFEDSIANDEKLKKIRDYYNTFLGKRIFWESLQDRGRTIKESDDEEYVYLQMTDLLAFSDTTEETGEVVDHVGKAGSFNLS